jgi:hypothetical protein
MFAGAPLYAISRSNWNPKSAEGEVRCSKRLVMMVPGSTRRFDSAIFGTIYAQEKRNEA